MNNVQGATLFNRKAIVSFSGNPLCVIPVDIGLCLHFLICFVLIFKGKKKLNLGIWERKNLKVFNYLSSLRSSSR